MSYFGRMFKWLPSPIKSLREHLHIEQEWQEFKHHIRPHQYKIYLAVIVLTYPLYAPQAVKVKNWVSFQVASRVNSFLSVDRSAFQLTDNLYRVLYEVQKNCWDRFSKTRI
jgi:hypothetical protein